MLREDISEFLNTIDKDITHEYTATLTYLDDGTNQSDDMNKTIDGKFNIIDTNDTAIIEGKVTNTTKTQYYVQTNSTKRVSFIDSDGNYKILFHQATLYKDEINLIEF